METDYLVVVTTFETERDAETLANAAVEKRLAACAQISGPMKSVYWWQGKIESAAEWKCAFKTSADYYLKLEDYIKKTHPYETPEIVALPIVKGSGEYLDWLADELKK